MAFKQLKRCSTKSIWKKKSRFGGLDKVKFSIDQDPFTDFLTSDVNIIIGIKSEGQLLPYFVIDWCKQFYFQIEIKNEG